MPKQTHNCLFCDSARHTAPDCNSTMKGKYKKLQLVMLENTCPDFTSYNYKELKLMCYANPFDNNLAFVRDSRNTINVDIKYFNRVPIPITLSKTRLIRALRDRWHKLRPISEAYNKGFDPNDINNDSDVNTPDCPVCLESICHGVWDFKESKWTGIYKVNTIKTRCNHHFCNSCWYRLPSSRNHNNNYDCLSKTCPLCRTPNGDTDTMFLERI